MAEREADTSGATPTPTVFVVEDDKSIAMLLRFIVERAGLRVEHAENGRVAQGMIATLAPPALVLLDIMLPYADGFELLDTIRSQPGWEGLPAHADVERQRDRHRARARRGRRRLHGEAFPARRAEGAHAPPDARSAVRHAYDLGMTGVVHFAVDRYVGDERFGYTLYAGGPDGSGTSSSHRWQWAHHYGERDWIGLSAAFGRETESVGAAGFLTSRVHGLSLSGRHELANARSLVWEAGRVRQGEAYTRSGARLGLRHSF